MFAVCYIMHSPFCSSLSRNLSSAMLTAIFTSSPTQMSFLPRDDDAFVDTLLPLWVLVTLAGRGTAGSSACGQYIPTVHISLKQCLSCTAVAQNISIWSPLIMISYTSMILLLIFATISDITCPILLLLLRSLMWRKFVPSSKCASLTAACILQKISFEIFQPFQKYRQWHSRQSSTGKLFHTRAQLSLGLANSVRISEPRTSCWYIGNYSSHWSPTMGY